MNRSAPAHRPAGRSRLILASGVVALLLLIGAAGLRGVSRAEAIGHSFVEQTYAESLALGELRSSVLQVRSAEKELLVAQPKGRPGTGARAAWEQAVSTARTQARRLAGSADVERAAVAARVDGRLSAYADATRPALPPPEAAGAYPVAAAAATDQALDPARKLLDAAERDLATLAEQLGREATGSDEARRQASRQGYGLFAVTVLCSVVLAAALAVPGPPGAAAGQPADSADAESARRRRPPEYVPTLQPEVVTPDYSGIERRGPDRPQNIVRAAFNPKDAPGSPRAGPDDWAESQ